MKKYICDQHKIVTTRKGLRKHIRDEHTRKALTSINSWRTEEIGGK